jgi:hypothetical protein
MDPSLQALLSRLDQLTDEFRELREGVQKAVRVADLDPEMALTRARKVLEYVIRDVYEQRIKESPGTRPLENLLQRIVKDGYFPDRLDAYASAVRKLGNVGVHSFGEKVTVADVYQSLAQLIPILEWYCEVQRPEAMGRPAPAVAVVDEVMPHPRPGPAVAVAVPARKNTIGPLLEVFPASISDPEELAQPMNSARTPGLVMLIVATLGFVVGLVGTIAVWFQGSDASMVTTPVEMLGGSLYYLSTAAASAVGVLGAIAMVTRRMHWLAVIGSVMVMWGSCMCLGSGVVVGVWSLVVLFQPQTRAAFDQQ